MAGKFRFSRLSSVDAVLPPPLPLIHLPDEARQANTGVPGLRPVHLPVRRHLVESRCGGGERPMREPEPILRESRLLVEIDAEENEAREIVARLRVYEYNQPELSLDDDTLVFDALFESGNLQRAERIYRRESSKAPEAAAKRQEYELTIHPDIKNSAYRQWFYFEVRNGTPGVAYKFSLANLAKSGALFGSGLQPVVYSEVAASTKGVGWVHRGTNVRYDGALAGDCASGSTCLSFQYEFAHANDRVYFACLQPYTYTDLTEYLEAMERDPERAAVCRRTELCQTIAQNSCDLLTITSSGKDGVPPDERRVIVLSARVHPGEPNSSWMMKGMIDYLVGPSSGAQVLRRHFIFKVVPMLNPDGVVNGNTRVNLAGWDLNRKWSYPVEKLFPTVYHLKRQIATLQARDRVAIYCDLHGHSLNRNIFTYGCYNKKSGGGSSKRSASLPGAPTTTTSSSSSSSGGGSGRASVKNDPRVFPMVVAKNAHFFSFASCDFKVHKSKLNTARVVVNHELGVINSYTLEASFCGPDFGPRKDTQFSTWDLEDMGASWCQSLLVYFDLVAEANALDASKSGDAQSTAPLAHSPSTGVDSVDSLSAAAAAASLSGSLLSDCEAAISELVASSVDVECDDDADEKKASLDSDVSGAEDEPIPPNQGDKAEFLRRATAPGDSVDDYSHSSAWEDGGEQTSPERRDRRRRTAASRACKFVKKSGGKRVKSVNAKRDKREPTLAAAEAEAEAEAEALSTPAAPDPAAPAVHVKKKAVKKKRRKRKDGKKERRPKSLRRRPKKSAASSESEEEDGDDDGDDDDDEEEEGGEPVPFTPEAPPLTSSGAARPCSRSGAGAP